MIELEPSYILHSRPFSETSAILEVFTKSYGRVSLLCKGIKRKNSKFKGLGSPFIPILISYTNKNALGNIVNMELYGRAKFLCGLQLISGLYINELLVKLLPVSQPYPELFDIYATTILELSQNNNVELALRYFERDLLKCIGYEMRLTTDVSNNPINPKSYYEYIIEHGPSLINRNITQNIDMDYNNISNAGEDINCSYSNSKLNNNKISGKNTKNLYLRGDELLKFVSNSLVERDTIKKLKHLMRSLISHYLDGKSLNVRKMF